MEEKVFLINKRGLKLASIVHKPQSKGVSPAVILLHGFTGYKEEEHIVSLAKDLATNGFVAIRFDASGFGESEGTLEKDFRFSNYLSDISIVLNYLKGLPYVDKEYVSIWGHSLGGMLSVIFGSENEGIKKVVSVSVPYLFGVSGKLGEETPKWKQQGWMERESSKFGRIRIPYEFMEDAEKYNVLNYVEGLKKPLLVVLGKKDKYVPPEDSKRIYDEANEPKELFEAEDLDHDYKRHPDLIKLVDDKIISFLRS